MLSIFALFVNFFNFLNLFHFFHLFDFFNFFNFLDFFIPNTHFPISHIGGRRRYPAWAGCILSVDRQPWTTTAVTFAEELCKHTPR